MYVLPVSLSVFFLEGKCSTVHFPSIIPIGIISVSFFAFTSFASSLMHSNNFTESSLIESSVPPLSAVKRCPAQPFQCGTSETTFEEPYLLTKFLASTILYPLPVWAPLLLHLCT